jgi:hypothetical protein
MNRPTERRHESAGDAAAPSTPPLGRPEEIVDWFRRRSRQPAAALLALRWLSRCAPESLEACPLEAVLDAALDAADEELTRDALACVRSFPAASRRRLVPALLRRYEARGGAAAEELADAIEALDAFDPPEAARRALAYLQHPDDGVACAAIGALHGSAEPASVAAAIERAIADRPNLIPDALRVLAGLGAAEEFGRAVEFLLRNLEDIPRWTLGELPYFMISGFDLVSRVDRGLYPRGLDDDEDDFEEEEDDDDDEDLDALGLELGAGARGERAPPLQADWRERLSALFPSVDPDAARRARQALPPEEAERFVAAVDEEDYEPAAALARTWVEKACALALEDQVSLARRAPLLASFASRALDPEPFQRHPPILQEVLLATALSIFARLVRGRDADRELAGLAAAPHRAAALCLQDEAWLTGARAAALLPFVDAGDLEPLLSSEDDRVAANALSLLAILEPRGFMSDLVESLDERDRRTAHWVWEAAARRWGDDLLPILESCLTEHPSAMAAETVVAALKTLDSEEAARAAEKNAQALFFDDETRVTAVAAIDLAVDLRARGLAAALLGALEEGRLDLEEELSAADDVEALRPHAEKLLALLDDSRDSETIAERSIRKYLERRPHESSGFDEIDDGGDGDDGDDGDDLEPEDLSLKLSPKELLLWKEVIEGGPELAESAADAPESAAEDSGVPDEYWDPDMPVPGVTLRRDEPKVGRNDPCPCGSGKKFKKCCGR